GLRQPEWHRGAPAARSGFSSRTWEAAPPVEHPRSGRGAACSSSFRPAIGSPNKGSRSPPGTPSLRRGQGCGGGEPPPTGRASPQASRGRRPRLLPRRPRPGNSSSGSSAFSAHQNQTADSEAGTPSSTTPGGQAASSGAPAPVKRRLPQLWGASEAGAPPRSSPRLSRRLRSSRLGPSLAPPGGCRARTERRTLEPGRARKGAPPWQKRSRPACPQVKVAVAAASRSPGLCSGRGGPLKPSLENGRRNGKHAAPPTRNTQTQESAHCRPKGGGSCGARSQRQTSLGAQPAASGVLKRRSPHACAGAEDRSSGAWGTHKPAPPGRARKRGRFSRGGGIPPLMAACPASGQSGRLQALANFEAISSRGGRGPCPAAASAPPCSRALLPGPTASLGSGAVPAAAAAAAPPRLLLLGAPRRRLRLGWPCARRRLLLSACRGRGGRRSVGGAGGRLLHPGASPAPSPGGPAAPCPLRRPSPARLRRSAARLPASRRRRWLLLSSPPPPPKPSRRRSPGSAMPAGGSLSAARNRPAPGAPLDPRAPLPWRCLACFLAPESGAGMPLAQDGGAGRASLRNAAGQPRAGVGR
ncbi:translation initiation factor IF-2-like, partial [Podarcis raffonei]|uniref:translation initiation factor IF-2-like n=1 Tax=Podarcis raffonei TaxID=65483 RepID=UPI0023293DE8